MAPVTPFQAPLSKTGSGRGRPCRPILDQPDNVIGIFGLVSLDERIQLGDEEGDRACHPEFKLDFPLATWECDLTRDPFGVSS